MVIPSGAQEKVRAFYGSLLGLEEKPVPHTLKHLNLVWFKAGEGEMELHFVPNSMQSRPEDPRHICLVVDDLDEYRRRLTEAGYTIVDAEPIPHRPRIFCQDPFDNRLELTSIEGNYLDEQ